MKISDATGEVLWSEFWGPSSAWNESVFALDVDSQGDLIVGGRRFIDGNNDDYLVLKFDGGDGSLIWEYTRDGAAGGFEDRIWDVVVDADDNTVATGIGFDQDGTAQFCTFKLDPDGDLIWIREETGAVQNSTPAGWLALDAAGNAIMANRSWVSGEAYNVVLRKYAAGDGATIWESGYDSESHGTDDPRGMCLDSAGKILVAGVSNSDYMTLKFDETDGSLIWQSGYDGPPGWYDLANTVTESPAGEVLVTGFSSSEMGGWDVLIQALDPQDGVELWTQRYNGADDLTDEGMRIACSNLGDIYLVGYSYAFATDQDQLLIRYRAGATDLPPGIAEAGLLAAWPNPFRSSTTLRLSLESRREVELGVYDVTGRLVRRLDGGLLEAGERELIWDGRDDGGRELPAGVYFAGLKRGGEIEGRAKLLLVK